MEGQSPEHLRRMNRTPSHTCPTLCPASSVPTQDPSGLAPPPPCVYSGRTRNRTWPQSKPTTVSTTRLRCHPDCSPRDWQWPGVPLGGGLYRGPSLAQSCPAGVQAFGSSFFPCGLGQECRGRAWGSCGEGCDFPEMLRLVPTLAWVQGREREKDWGGRATEVTSLRVPHPSWRETQDKWARKGAGGKSYFHGCQP